MAVVRNGFVVVVIRGGRQQTQDDGTDPGDKTSEVLDDADDAETHPDDAFNADADAFVDLYSRGLQQSESKINAVDLFKRLEYMNPQDAKLRVPYQFSALVQLQQLIGVTSCAFSVITQSVYTQSAQDCPPIAPLVPFFFTCTAPGLDRSGVPVPCRGCGTGRRATGCDGCCNGGQLPRVPHTSLVTAIHHQRHKMASAVEGGGSDILHLFVPTSLAHSGPPASAPCLPPSGSLCLASCTTAPVRNLLPPSCTGCS